MHNSVLCYNRHINSAKPNDALRICLPEVKLKKAFQICHKEIVVGHREIYGMLDKFLRRFFVLSACDKIRRFFFESKYLFYHIS